MKTFFIHNVVFRLLAPAVYGVLVYLVILLINNNVEQINEIFSSGEIYSCIVLTYISFETLRITILLLNRFLRDKYKFIRIPIQLTVSTLVSTLMVMTCLNLYFIYFIGFSIATSQFILFSLIYIFSGLLYNLLYFSNDYLHRENTLKLSAERQQREVLEMEMTEFKNDINPDLLYESLENVISLMNKKNDEAEEYIDYLASAYRYVLANRQRELISLSVEIDAGKNIIRLLNESYFGLLNITITVTEKDFKWHLIPGSLPIVIEYLVRNTIVSTQPLSIHCYLEDEYFVIQTPLNDRLLLHTESEFALTRLQKSYTLYTDHPMIQVKAYEENYIKLPLLTVTDDALISHA